MNIKKLQNTFMVVIAVAVLVSFGWGILLACIYTFRETPEEMPKIMLYLVSTVNGVLAANLGILLGLKLSPGSSQEPKGVTEVLQWLAAGWYLLMLLLAFVFWGTRGFPEESDLVVSALPEMANNAVGIFVSVLAAMLGVQVGTRRANAAARDAGKSTPA